MFRKKKWQGAFVAAMMPQPLPPRQHPQWSLVSARRSLAAGARLLAVGRLAPAAWRCSPPPHFIAGEVRLVQHEHSKVDHSNRGRRCHGDDDGRDYKRPKALNVCHDTTLLWVALVTDYHRCQLRSVPCVTGQTTAALSDGAQAWDGSLLGA